MALTDRSCSLLTTRAFSIPEGKPVLPKELTAFASPCCGKDEEFGNPPQSAAEMERRFEAENEDGSLTEDERIEMARLGTEIRRVRLERDILKKRCCFVQQLGGAARFLEPRKNPPFDAA